MLNRKDKQQRETIDVGDVSTASMAIYSQWGIDLKTLCEKKLYNAYIISCYTVYLVKCSLTNTVAVDKQLLLILFHSTKQPGPSDTFSRNTECNSTLKTIISSVLIQSILYGCTSNL